MTYAASTFHQLHLLLVGLHDTTVGVGVAIVADDETIRQRRNLEIVADARHGAALRHDVAEALQHLKNLLFGHWVGVFPLDASYLAGDAVVHVVRRQLVDVAVAVLECIFVGPYVTCQRVAMEIFLGGGLHFFKRIDMVLDFLFFFCQNFGRFHHLGFFLFHHLNLILILQCFSGKSDVFPRFNNLFIRGRSRLFRFGFPKATK